MANEVARLNKPTVISGAEDDFSDWDFALTCFVGTMDGTLLKELQAIASDPRVMRTPTDEARKRESTHALQYLGTADDKRTRTRWYEKYQSKTGTKRTEVSY